MRKSLFVFLALAMTSCSAYQQVATISPKSSNVSLNDNGQLQCVKQAITITYDFWSAGGYCTFLVENNSGEDISLDLGRSFFVNNGYAHDYFQNRTFGYGRSVANASKSTIGGMFGRSSSVSLDYGYAGMEDSFKSVVGQTLTNAVASSSSTSVSYDEKDVVVIPAHSQKVFGEFRIADGAYRECGLGQRPAAGKKYVKTYSMSETPFEIENRLMFVVGGADVPVNNVFYVSEIANAPINSITEKIDAEDCSGRKPNIKYNIYGAPFRYYLNYTPSTYDDKVKGEKAVSIKKDGATAKTSSVRSAANKTAKADKATKTTKSTSKAK